jgi:hypothetical protein
VTLPTLGHRFTSSARAVLAGALFLSALLAVPTVAHAVSPGSGGWYWPVGTENFQGWDGWWTYRPQNPPRWHMAQDMPAPVGHPVYAVGDGTVLESGGDHGYGGVIVVLHKTADGHYFKAVYGHIIPAASAHKGAKVKAGQVVGRVNRCAHVHFGIHPGKAYPPDNNPYRGHTYDSKKTYGWVDPVKYLRANPRVITYSAPKLPVIATVDTTGHPSVLGVAAGTVYWTIGAGDDLLTFCRSLDGGEALAVTSDADIPSLDTTRFPARIGEASFTVDDRLPLLTLAASTATPSWKHAVSLSGRLTNVIGAPFKGATITLESSQDGEEWKPVATAKTGLTGAYAVSWTPPARVRLRVRFLAPTLYLPAASALTTVAPEPALTSPSTPKTVAQGRVFTVHGTLAPRHAAGPGAVTIRVQRNVAGFWTDYSVVPAACHDSKAGSTYTASLHLPAGSWRLRAQVPADAAHAAGSSAWSSLAVR